MVVESGEMFQVFLEVVTCGKFLNFEDLILRF